MPVRKEKAADVATGGRRGGWIARLFGAQRRADALTESYRRLAVQLDLDLGKGETGWSVLLTSPDSAAVTREATLELAYSLAAELGHRVLLIDASFSKSGVSEPLGHQSSAGLVEVMRNETHDLKTTVLSTSHERVFLLPLGQAAGGEVLLRSSRLERILEQACAKYDYVLIQACPILKDAKCLLFPSLVHYVLLLTIEGKTLINQLEESQKALADCRASRVGLVLTKTRRRWFERG